MPSREGIKLNLGKTIENQLLKAPASYSSVFIINYELLECYSFHYCVSAIVIELRVLHVFLASRAFAHPVRFYFLNRSGYGRNYGEVYLVAHLIRILNVFV